MASDQIKNDINYKINNIYEIASVNKQDGFSFPNKFNY
jgi:hypothetical protein